MRNSTTWLSRLLRHGDSVAAFFAAIIGLLAALRVVLAVHGAMPPLTAVLLVVVALLGIMVIFTGVQRLRSNSSR